MPAFNFRLIEPHVLQQSQTTIYERRPEVMDSRPLKFAFILVSHRGSRSPKYSELAHGKDMYQDFSHVLAQPIFDFVTSRCCSRYDAVKISVVFQ